MTFATESAKHTNKPVVILEMGLATIRYYAAHDVELDNFYEGRVLSFGEIHRTVSDIESSFDVGDVTTVLANTDNLFGGLTQTGFLNKKVTYKIGFEGDAIGDYQTVFKGVIVDFSYTESEFEIVVRDQSALYMDKEYGHVLTDADWPKAVPGVTERKMPILYGDLDRTNDPITFTMYSDKNDGFITNRAVAWRDARDGTGELTKAELSLYSRTAGADNAIVQEGTHAATLTTADFDSFTGNLWGDADFSGAVGYKNFTLNSHGKTYVDDLLGTSTKAKLCCREKDYDYDDVDPPTDTGKNAFFYMSGQAGTTQDPKLVLTIDNVENTIYPSSDGEVYHEGFSSTWAAVHDAITGTSVTNNPANGQLHASDSKATDFFIRRAFCSFDLSGIGMTFSDNDAYSTDAIQVDDVTDYTVSRAFFRFDLSNLPYTDSITTATFSLYVYPSTLRTGIYVQEGTQGDTLSRADFNAYTGDYFAYKYWAGMSGYQAFTFNAAGKDYLVDILGDDFARFCCRESTSDYDDIVPTSGANIQNGCYFADETGMTKDPKLVLTYIPKYGIVEAICIDQEDSVWLIAGHAVKSIDEVYVSEKGTTKNPKLRTSGYTATASHTYAGGLSGKIAILEFTENRPLSSDKVFVNVQGMMDGSSNLITNPVDQLEHFIKEYLGMTSAEYDTTNFTATAAVATTRSYATGGRIAGAPQARSVIEEMARSVGASLYFANDGKLNVSFLL